MHHHSNYRGHPSHQPPPNLGPQASPEGYNYGLNEHSYQRFKNSERAAEFDRDCVSRLRQPPPIQKAEGMKIPKMGLGEGGEVSEKGTPYWMKPMQFVPPGSEDKVHIYEFPSIDADRFEVAYLEDGVLDWQKHYTKKYANVMDSMQSKNGQAKDASGVSSEQSGGKASGFRKLKKK